jgi:hypothetical protein
MPTKPRPADNLLNLFLFAYDDFTWATASLTWLDQEQDGTVELLAKRADGMTLAIEHTLIESFIGEREDFERFKAFLAIQDDPSLVTPGKIVYINVPRGVLAKGQPWQQIVSGVHQWLRANIHALPNGESTHTCVIGSGVPDVSLQARVIPEPKFSDHPIIRRYGAVNVGETVEKALKAKLPKLVATTADKRILLLERNQWSLSERGIHAEVERSRSAFPSLAQVEVWSVETVTASADGTRGYVDFKRYQNGDMVENIAFNDGALFSRSRDGMPLTR